MATFDEIARTPRLKIERAKYHVNDLSGKINAYLAQKPYTLVFRSHEK